MKYIKKFESKQVGILYHYTSINSLFSILKDNKLKLFTSSICFTRNKNLAKITEFTHCRLVIDGDKLSNNYKLIPYDFRYYDEDWEDDECEERCGKEINNVLKYIIRIDISLHWYQLLTEEQLEFMKYLNINLNIIK